MGTRRLLYLMTPCVLGRKEKGELRHQEASSSISSIRAVMHVHMYLVALVVSDSVTPRTVARQAPWSMGFSRQEYWTGLPLPSPGDLPNPGTELGSPASQADSLPSEPPGPCLLILYIVEGNSTPLQYSCLENPMDGGAWWAAVHGVAKSRT